MRRGRGPGRAPAAILLRPRSFPTPCPLPYTHPSSLPRSRSLTRVRNGGASCLAGRPAASAPSRPRSRPATNPRRPPRAPLSARAGPGPRYTLRGERPNPTCLRHCSPPWASGLVLDTGCGRLLYIRCRKAYPAHPRGPQSHVPGQRLWNLRPSRPAATSPGSQEGTFETRLPPTAGLVCSGPVVWHILEGEDEGLNSLLTPT